MIENRMRHGGNVWEGGKPSQWLDFSANLRADGTPDWVMQTMREALVNTRYYPDRSMTAARRGLSDYAGVLEECVLPTAGGIAAIDLALSLHRGAVYIQSPTFGGYAERAAVYGRAVYPWQGKCAPDDTVVLCNPNNPTGRALKRTEVLAIYAQVRQQGGELLVDEAFIDYCEECSVRSDITDGLIVTGSLTKTLCIPGVRLGYVCAVPQIIARMEARALSWSLCTLASAVAEKLPQHRAQIRSDAQSNCDRREKLMQALTRLGAKVEPSQANFLLVDFGRDMTQTATRLKRAGVLVRTCASFGLGARYLRLAVKNEEENKRLIALLEEDMRAR